MLSRMDMLSLHDDQEAVKRDQKRLRSAACIVLLLVIGTSWVMSGRIALRICQANIRADGYPATPTDLADWYVDSQGTETWAEYVECFSAYREPPEAPKPTDPDEPSIWDMENDWRYEELGTNMPEPVLDYYREVVATNQEVLTHLRSKANFEPVNVPLPLTFAEGNFYDKIMSPYFGIGTLFNNSMCLSSSEGSVDRAIADACIWLQLSHAMTNNSEGKVDILWSWVRIYRALEHLERNIFDQDCDAAELSRLQSLLEEMRPLNNVANRLAFYRAISIDDPDSILEEEPGYFSTPPVFTFLGLDTPGKIRAYQTSGEMIEEITIHEQQPELWDLPSTPMLIFFKAYAIHDSQLHIISSTVMAAGRIRISQVALAVKRYQLEHGKLPASLDVLMPKYIAEIPKDPFDGNPIRYRIVGDTARIYSVDYDRNDDGGRTRLEREKQNEERGDRYNSQQITIDMVFQVR